MTKPIDKISCIILAGGEGKRAGRRDKGLIEYQDRPLIEHVIEKVRHQVDDIVISANRNLNTYQQYSENVICDSSSEYQGPLAGICACLPYCNHAYALVVACDMPGLPTDLVTRLSIAIENSDVAIASVAGHHQLAMIIKTSQSDIIQIRLQNQQRKLIQWVESINFVIVDFDDSADAFTNLNHLSAN